MSKFLNVSNRRLFTRLTTGFLCICLLLGSLTFLEMHYQKKQYTSGANWSFISRSGSTLLNNGTPFKFSGANMHWLGLDDPLGGTYPSHFRIDDAMTIGQEMGMTAVRSHTLGVSVGCSKCIEPSLNQWNDTAFNTIDYAIKSAHDHNIRLIIPLTDNWHYYGGGKHTFTDWENDSNEDDFYSNPIVIHDFENYISHVLTHVNQFTGIALKDDPTIMAWETGNELNNATSAWDDNWTQMIAKYIKSIDPNHLVADGHTAESNVSRNLSSSQLQQSAVDMYTDHFYPPRISVMQANANLAKQYDKVYYIGEYDWSDKGTISAPGNPITNNSFEKNGSNWLSSWNFQVRTGGDTLANFLSAIESTSGVSGDLFWELYGHDDVHGYDSNDAYTFHYPGDTSDMQNRAQLLRTHDFKIRGITTLPHHLIPSPPVINSITMNTNGVVVDWQGSAAAASYNLEMTTDGINWRVVKTGLTDTNVPADPLTSGTASYKLIPVSLDGLLGGASNIVPPLSASTVHAPTFRISGDYPEFIS